VACAGLSAALVCGAEVPLPAQIPFLVGSSSDAAAGPLERSAKPVTAENPIPRRLTSVMPAYPPDAPPRPATDTVLVLATLDASGRVAEARVVRSLAAPADVAPLEAAALDAVRQWTFAPPADPPLRFQVSILFAHDSSAFVTFGVNPAPPATAKGGQQVAAWLGAKTRINPRKIRDRKPVFPSGVSLDRGERALVIIEIELDTEGRIVAQRLVRGSQPFVDAAMEAVRGWGFSPALADGKAVPFTMSVTVTFQGG
jgi:protein TonB